MFHRHVLLSLKLRHEPGTGLRCGPHRSPALFESLPRKVRYSRLFAPARPRHPRRKTREAGEIDGGEDVRHVGRGHVEFGEQFDFSASNAGITVQFSRDTVTVARLLK